MGEGFLVSTCIFIRSFIHPFFILSFFLFPAHTCDHPSHTTQGPTPGAQDAPSDSATVYLFSLLCPLNCATLHLSVLASSPLWPRKFLQVFEDSSDPRVLKRSSEQTKIEFWTLDKHVGWKNVQIMAKIKFKDCPQPWTKLSWLISTLVNWGLATISI